MSPLHTRAPWRRAGIVLCAASATALAGCARTIEPGRGTLGKTASERLDREEREAETANALVSLGAADRAPGDTRASRKASELATRAIHSTREKEAKARIVHAAKPTVARLAASGDVCVDAELAARLEEAAEDLARAAELRVRAADTCRTPKAILVAADTLRRDKRCREAVRVVERGWQYAPAESWTDLMDAVAACSDSVTLRMNLAFVPTGVREDYFALLDERARKRRAAEAARALQDAVDRANAQQEAQLSQRRSACSSHCYNAQSSCMSSCASSPSCSSYCSSVQSSCLAGCQ